MKKKRWLNSKISFTIVLVFVLCCFMATSSWAAKKVEFYQANANGYIKQLNENKSLERVSIGKTLGLTRDEEFKLLRKITDFNGVTHYRYQQAFKDIPVWGMQTIVSVDDTNKAVRLHGTLVLDITDDIKSIPPASSLDPLGALTRMQDLHKQRDPGAVWSFRNEKYETAVYIDKKNKAHLCWVVSFFADTGKGNPSQFIHFIDVNTGKVLDSFDMLRYQGVGPGGNLKVGYYYYGTNYPGFCVTEAAGTCTMDCTDVRTVDLNHGTSGTTPYSYPCYENTHEEINGAYCPLNDAQYFGQAVYDMYNNWYGVPPLPFQLTIRCHYSTNFEGAMWDGSNITLGDGYTVFYPLVSLDVISHEASHGFTQNNSDLIYAGQAGGINESFSDMAGEAAEYYMRGTTDFMCGYDIFKDPTGAIRYLYDPPLDGMSIDHFDDYYEGMDVHYSSGIFNKAFYLIATTTDWTPRMAFDIFVKANQDYWIPSSTFVQGAEGAMNAAVDYGYSCQDVVNAFEAVGINLTCPPPCPGFITNPGFETGDTSGWIGTGDVGITSDSHTGSYAVSLNGADSSVKQVITDLCSSTTYTVSCWGKAKANAKVYLGVKDYGGAAQTVQFKNGKSFVKKSVTFTTGTTNTSVTIFFTKSGSKLTGIGDDFEIN